MGKADDFIASMHHWCEDMDMHYGQGNAEFPLPRYDFRYGGSTDCTAMVAHCANEAGYGIPASVWSGNIADCLEEIGWTRSYDDGYPPHGAVLVSYANHAAAWDGNTMQIVEFGGDPHQGYCTTHGFYDYPWDCYVCPPSDSVENQQNFNSISSGHRYSVYTREHGFVENMYGLECSCGDPDCTDDFAGIEGEWIYGMDADFYFMPVFLIDGHSVDGEWTMHQEDTGNPICGIKIEDFKYQVHVVAHDGHEGAWLKVEIGMADDGAGDDEHPIDLLRVW